MRYNRNINNAYPGMRRREGNDIKRIKAGIFGCGRGLTLMKNIMACNGEIAALCDQDPALRNEAVKALGGSAPKGVYERFDDFISHPGLQAVVLADHFHEHAALAVRCLQKNIHVLTECPSNFTMAEGVGLVRAAGQSKAVFMLAENYSCLQFNQEMRRIFRGGTLGRVLFAEGECSPSPAAHSVFVPASYGLAHSLAPLMYITGSFPRRVTAMPVYEPPGSGMQTGAYSAVISLLNADGSVFRVTGSSHFGACSPSYRICGENGQIENIRGGGGRVMLRYNSWQIPEGRKEINCYMPSCPESIRALTEKAGYDRGDYFIAHEFLRCIREGKRPEFDEFFATSIASAGILAWRSLLKGGVPLDIPDFHLESDRLKYENDHELPRPCPGGG